MSNRNIGRIDGVVFDLDGTLIDAFAPIITALNQTLREFGRPEMTPEEIKRHTGKGGAGIRPIFPDHVEEAGARFLELHDALYLDQVYEVPGARSILDWLAGLTLPIAVVTSKGQQRAEAQIERLGWGSYFQSIIGRVDGRPEKPSPIPVQMACEALQRSCKECIMIGDGIGDMQAGSDAGLFTIGITDSFSIEELEHVGADICFDSLIEAHRWLQKKIG